MRGKFSPWSQNLKFKLNLRWKAENFSLWNSPHFIDCFSLVFFFSAFSAFSLFSHRIFKLYCWNASKQKIPFFLVLMKYFRSFSAWRSTEKLSSDVKCVYCHFHAPASQYKHTFTSNKSIKNQLLLGSAVCESFKPFVLATWKLFCNVSSVSYFLTEPLLTGRNHSFFTLRCLPPPHTAAEFKVEKALAFRGQKKRSEASAWAQRLMKTSTARHSFEILFRWFKWHFQVKMRNFRSRVGL